MIQSLVLVTDNIERELDFVSNSDQTMHRRSRLDFVIRSIDRKLAARSQIVSSQSHPRRNHNPARHAVQSEIAAYLQLVLAVAERLSFHIGALENDLGILGR